MCLIDHLLIGASQTHLSCDSPGAGSTAGTLPQWNYVQVDSRRSVCIGSPADCSPHLQPIKNHFSLQRTQPLFLLLLHKCESAGLTEQLLDLAVDPEGEQWLRKLSEECLQDHGRNVHVSYLLEVHRLPCMSLNKVNFIDNAIFHRSWTQIYPQMFKNEDMKIK